MDYINKRVKSSGLTPKKIYTIISVVAFLILALLGYILYSYSTPNIKKVSFFKDIRDTDKNITISKNKLSIKNGGKEYSFSLWLRINNWYNNDTNEKNIFSYGHRNIASTHPHKNLSDNNAVPSVWLDGVKNDLNIYVRTTNGTDQTPIKVKNVPLKKWFKLTIVMTSNSIQVFLNSKLDVFTFLNGDIIIPNGDLYLFTGDNKIHENEADVFYQIRFREEHFALINIVEGTSL